MIDCTNSTKAFNNYIKIKERSLEYNDRYDFSKFKYTSMRDSSFIFCKNCKTTFKQNLNSFFQGKIGCDCYHSPNLITTETYIKRFNKIHKLKYMYKQREINHNNPLIVTCPIHGDWVTSVYNHSNGHGCDSCAREGSRLSRLKSKEQIERELRNVHHDKYNYLFETDYLYYTEKINIECKEHGVFHQKITKHRTGQGCPECYNGTRYSPKITTLYVICVRLENLILTKIGITQNLDRRMEQFKKQQWGVIKYKTYEISTGVEAYKLEQNVLKKLTKYRNNINYGNGYTELLDYSYCDIVSIIDNIIKRKTNGKTEKKDRH